MKAWMIVPRLIAFAVIGYLLVFFALYYRMEKMREGSLEWVGRRKKPPFLLTRAGRMARADALPALLITVIYAAVTFVNLGDTVAPQSFRRFENGGGPVVIELREPSRIERVFYYTGLFHGDRKQGYTLHFSSDGITWEEQYAEKSELNKDTGEYDTVRLGGMSQDYSETFRWLTANILPGQADDTRYIRITATRTPLELGEVSVTVRENGRLVQDPDAPGQWIEQYDEKILTPADLIIPGGADELFDEPDAVPARYDVMNSTHFDEIYHARTAYEHLRGVYPYEKTHPPLGKLITASGIALFGMTPFGWRFMPALFGVFMVPLIYILLKWMFGKTPVAVCGTLLFAFDFMHFVQTRISTIDVYAVFFILCMYLFIYRYITSGLEAPFRRAAPSLFLAGLSFGLGAAAKWVCIYAGCGLLILYVVFLSQRAGAHRKLGRSFFPYLLKTLLFSLFCFILLPGAVYIACYIPYAAARDVVRTVTPETGNGAVMWLKEVWKICYDNQISMFSYHYKLEATHVYAARWYEWLIDWKPILYYWNPIDSAGTRGSIWAFTNPLTTWAGLGALIVCIVGFFKRHSHTALFILVGYLSQLLPWVAVTRITFPYHYFPSMIFVCLAVAYLFNRMVVRDPKRGVRRMAVFTVIAVLLFVMFYPSLSGLQTPTWYPLHLLRWLSHKTWLM